MAKQIADDFGEPVDTKATEDKAALLGAVRGQTVNQDDDAKKMEAFFNECTDFEFNEYKRTGKIPKSFQA
jgi:hypothetical protein